MKNMTLENIAKCCNGVYHGSPEIIHTEVTSITTDSRKIEAGCLFVAIKGAKSDGHDFINNSISDGAVCVISEKELGDGITYIKVNSSLEAIKSMAEFYREGLDVTVIGIAGSVGKTSTKETVASVLSEKYKVLKTLGNFNNELGLPLTIFRLTGEEQVAVLEMGISDFGEMHRLSRIAKPDICIMTNIGICHLENLKSRDGILKAKSEIFDYMNRNGRVILNGDDDKLITVKDANGIKPVFFGHNREFFVYADNIKSCGLRGTMCDIHTPDGIIDVTIPIPGAHMVSNVMAAVAVGVILNMTAKQIRDGISKLKPVSGRNNIIYGGKYTIIDDCYNANPISMRASIDVLDMADTRRVAILGDMGELGEDEEKLHYELGEYAGSSKTDMLLCVGKLSEATYKGFISKNNGIAVHFDSVDELIGKLPGLLTEGDSVLVKASHFMKFERIVEYLKDI